MEPVSKATRNGERRPRRQMLQLRRQLLQLLTVAAGAALLSFSLLLGPSAEVLAVAAEAVLVSAKAERLLNEEVDPSDGTWVARHGFTHEAAKKKLREATDDMQRQREKQRRLDEDHVLTPEKEPRPLSTQEQRWNLDFRRKISNDAVGAARSGEPASAAAAAAASAGPEVGSPSVTKGPDPNEAWAQRLWSQCSTQDTDAARYQNVAWGRAGAWAQRSLPQRGTEDTGETWVKQATTPAVAAASSGEPESPRTVSDPDKASYPDEARGPDEALNPIHVPLPS